MYKLFKKNEVRFALVLIAVYVVGVSLMQRVSEALGVEFLAEAVFGVALTAVLAAFIRRNGLASYLGLRRPEVPAARMLFYIPLALVAAGSAFFGVGMSYGPAAAVCHTAMMLCVGFLEEVIFRGFLFRGIARQSLKRAVVISAVTFGIGHIVNLLNGYAPFESAVQVAFAVAVGFVLVLVFLRTGSIWPCVAFHALNNCMTAFTTGAALTDRLGEGAATLALLAANLIVLVAYLLYLRRLPKRALPER